MDLCKLILYRQHQQLLMPHLQRFLVRQVFVLALPAVVDDGHFENSLEGVEPGFSVGLRGCVQQKVSRPSNECERVFVGRLGLARFLRGDQDLHDLRGWNRGAELVTFLAAVNAEAVLGFGDDKISLVPNLEVKNVLPPRLLDQPPARIF